PTAPPETYPLSLHDALPISDDRRELAGRHAERQVAQRPARCGGRGFFVGGLVRLGRRGRLGRDHLDRDRDRRWESLREPGRADQDRKSTRLNSSHLVISYAV